MAKAEQRVIKGCDVTVDRLDCGDGRVIYTAWQRCEPVFARYATAQHFGGNWYGRIGTETILPSIDALPAMSSERSSQYRKWRDSCYDDAYHLIVKAFPEAAAGRRDMGEIVVG